MSDNDQSVDSQNNGNKDKPQGDLYHQYFLMRHISDTRFFVEEGGRVGMVLEYSSGVCVALCTTADV